VKNSIEVIKLRGRLFCLCGRKKKHFENISGHHPICCENDDTHKNSYLEVDTKKSWVRETISK